MIWDRMRSFRHTLAVIAFMSLVSIAIAMVSVRQIERLTFKGVREALLTNGMEWAEVRIDGLRVILSGAAPDQATRRKAEQVAVGAAVFALVIDEMEIDGQGGVERRFSIEFLRSDKEILMIGVVPSSLDREELAVKVAELVDGAEVNDLLDRANYPVLPGWTQAVSYSIDALGQMPWSKISVQADRVVIEAVSESALQKSEIEARLGRTAPDGVELELNIAAPLPLIVPFTLRYGIDGDGARLDVCSAPNVDGSDRIVSAAVSAGLTGRVACRVGLGAPNDDWTDAVVAGIEAVERLGSGSLTILDTGMSLIAPAGIERTSFERVVGELESVLPEVFSLTVTVSDPPAGSGAGAERDGVRSEFTATLDPDGSLHLRGRITDAILRDAVEGYARVLFAGAEPDSALRVDTGLPNGWSGRVFAGLEALSLLDVGHLEIRPESIEIEGSADDPGTEGEISRLLTAALGATETLIVQISYVPPDEAAPGPTPEECVQRISAILANGQIGFEPGSAEIGRGSFEVIDRIAEAMDGCSEVKMEIGGHTDSQGGEEMNQRLSQGRAEAVLSALQSRRVLAGNLEPVGYGESRPIADNGTEAGREANRRIEFTLATDGDTAEDQEVRSEQK